MRRWRLALGILVAVGIALAIFFLRPVSGPERDLTLVADAARGEYLIRLGGCVACHTDTASEGEFLAGGQALKTAFGEFVPPNITPHPDAGIGGWTLELFSAAMSDGEGPGLLHHYYPAFPYDNFTLMSDQDIVDLYAGLMQVDPVAARAPDNRIIFPLSIRASLLGWKNLFFRPARFEPDPERSDTWNRGAYLVYGPAHCTACHTPRNLLGGPETGRALQGGPGTPGGKVPAITRERLIAQDYDRITLAEALKTGFTPGFDVLGGAMGEVVSESTSHWTDEDLDAVAAYLLDED